MSDAFQGPYSDINCHILSVHELDDFILIMHS